MAKIRTTICLDEKIIDKAKIIANSLGMSVSALLTMLINNYKE